MYEASIRVVFSYKGVRNYCRNHWISQTYSYILWRSSVVLHRWKNERGHLPPSALKLAHEPDFSLLSVLACSIKNSLTVSRKADSAVRIQLPFDMTEFQRLVEKGKSLGNSRYGLQSYSDMNELLGDKWHLRIININGDFSYVILETVCFYLIRPKPIIEFDVENSDDSTNLRFTPVYIEQGYSLVFKFVWGNGNSKKLSKFL